MSTTIYSTPNHPTLVVPVTKRKFGPIGLDGSPAGVAVFIELDLIRSRAHLLQLFAAAKAAVLADHAAPAERSATAPNAKGNSRG